MSTSSTREASDFEGNATDTTPDHVAAVTAGGQEAIIGAPLLRTHAPSSDDDGGDEERQVEDMCLIDAQV